MSFIHSPPRIKILKPSVAKKFLYLPVHSSKGRLAKYMCFGFLILSILILSSENIICGGAGRQRDGVRVLRGSRALRPQERQYPRQPHESQVPQMQVRRLRSGNGAATPVLATSPSLAKGGSCCTWWRRFLPAKYDADGEREGGRPLFGVLMWEMPYENLGQEEIVECCLFESCLIYPCFTKRYLGHRLLN